MVQRPGIGPWVTTVLCLLGIVVAGGGLAYALHESSRIGERHAKSTGYGTTVSQPLSGIAITPGRELVGSITSIDHGVIVIRAGAAGAATTELKTTEQTRVSTARGDGLSDLSVGDVVMVEVSADGGTALVILAGQISVAGEPTPG
jgi:hypothetical protein